MDAFSKLKGLRTLLIDDDELIRDSLSLAFSKKGCFIRTSETAEEGLRALEEENYDVIISDLKLPGIDGLEFLKLANTSHPNAINVLITAYGDKEIVSKAVRTVVHEFVQKPFSIKALITAITPLLERGNGKSQILKK